MRIVVVGAGKLGYSIAELLSKEQFEVVVIDEDEALASWATALRSFCQRSSLK